VRFTETEIAGVYFLETKSVADVRGAFTRWWDAHTLGQVGMSSIAQISASQNHRAGTIRGLHYALPPHAETKAVRCTRGAIVDVAVDLRAESPTFGRYVARRLDAQSAAALVIPPGVAHGFQTLVDDVEVMYAIDVAYVQEAAAAVRFDDPDLAIPWPLAVTVVSPRDAHASRLNAIEAVRL